MGQRRVIGVGVQIDDAGADPGASVALATRAEHLGYDLVLMARSELRGILVGANAELFIEQDEGLSMGDCVIETPSGSVDARLATQIELVRQAVREVMA